MEEQVQVTLSPELVAFRIGNLNREIQEKDKTIHDLRIQLQYEHSLRKELEEQIFSARQNTPPVAAKEKRLARSKTASDFKSDGKRKPHAADSIRSYNDFCAIQNYFLGKHDIRDWAMWTMGVSLGLRISDLLSLRFKNLVNDDKRTFRERIVIMEQKTGKQNNLLITDAVKAALERYMESIKYEFDLDGYLFASRKTGQKMYEEHGWRILSKAGKDLGLPLVIGSHTMRKSFANIAACVDKSCIDMNAITKVQGLLNHSDQRVTMKYLGTYQDMFDRARIVVSDFVLGKTGINEIVAGNQYTVDDVIGRLDALEEILSKKETLL